MLVAQAGAATTSVPASFSRASAILSASSDGSKAARSSGGRAAMRRNARRAGGPRISGHCARRRSSLLQGRDALLDRFVDQVFRIFTVVIRLFRLATQRLAHG